jgi:hypothetical protein
MKKGAQRYIRCHEYLSDHAHAFNIDRGVELLRKVCNQDPDYPTTCSLIRPQKNEVYIAWKGNLLKINKVSIEKEVIAAYEGYNHRKMLSIPAGEEGLPVSDVADYFDTP